MKKIIFTDLPTETDSFIAVNVKAFAGLLKATVEHTHEQGYQPAYYVENESVNDFINAVVALKIKEGTIKYVDVDVDKLVFVKTIDL
jgi:protein associated with RNAse G/E